VLDAPSALDIGCGTGLPLRRAREVGHRGRLCGLDPDSAALDRARTRTDIEWVEGKAADIAWYGEFALAVMAGNAFQVFVTDVDLRASLDSIRRALVDSGRFVFGTRNPEARAWEGWNPANAIEVLDHEGRELRVVHRVESVVDDVVTFTETIARRDGTQLRVDRASLRFLDAETLDGFLDDAGFAIEARYGDWSCGPLTDTSEAIVVVGVAV
jgi:SAM-dependent methyltransferase